jgi:uncharacterized RDD family membrane protein YckC
MLTVTADGEMVVATPERVAFNYALAGLGSRFLAQLIDVLIVGLAYLGLMVGIFGVAGVTTSPQLATLIYVLLGNTLILGYFLICEAATSGRTPGKAALRLRAVGGGGEPISVSQAAIRNVVRLADYLPVFYGVGIIALFASGRGKRLGDLAAGTVVVRERAAVTLPQLVRWAEASLARTARAAPAADPAGGATPPPAPVAAQPRLDPALRDFVLAYRGRRHGLHPHRRAQLAESARPALVRALPDVVAREGTLAALDRLADLL